MIFSFMICLVIVADCHSYRGVKQNGVCQMKFKRKESIRIFSSFARDANYIRELAASIRVG